MPRLKWVQDRDLHTYTMDHLHIDNMYNGINWESGYIRKLTNSYLGGSISHYGMLIKNAVNADNGDDVVSNNQIRLIVPLVQFAMKVHRDYD